MGLRYGRTTMSDLCILIENCQLNIEIVNKTNKESQWQYLMKFSLTFDVRMFYD